MIYHCNSCDHYFQLKKIPKKITCPYCGSTNTIMYYAMNRDDLMNDIYEAINYCDENTMMKYVFSNYNTAVDEQDKNMEDYCDDDDDYINPNFYYDDN